VKFTDLADGQALVYDAANSLWVNGEGAGGGGLTVSETAPASPASGDMWFASAEGTTYVYYDSYWVEMSPAIAGPQGPEGPSGQANFSSFLLMGA
jgi:hypothetical protein